LMQKLRNTYRNVAVIFIIHFRIKEIIFLTINQILGKVPSPVYWLTFKN
jgi:hypothetical protein